LAAASGCTKLLGTFEGPGGTGASTASISTSGSGGTTGSGGTAGACSINDGMGMVSLTDVSMANLMLPMFYGFDGSISATYYMQLGYTEIIFSGSPSKQYSDLGGYLEITRRPMMGNYTVVATSPYEGPTFATGSMNAYVFVSATPVLDGGGDAEPQAFGSIAGSGTVQITSVDQTRVKFTVTNVQAAGISDSTCAGMGFQCDGQGTIQMTIQGEADCLSTL
jgi:hypothetical protein